MELLAALIFLGLLAFFGVRGLILIGKIVGVLVVLFFVYIFLFPDIGSMLKDPGGLMLIIMIGGGFLFISILFSIWLNQQEKEEKK